MRMKRPRSLRTNTLYAITRSRKGWDRYRAGDPDAYWAEVDRSDKYRGQPLNYIWSLVREQCTDVIAAMSTEYEALERSCA